MDRPRSTPPDAVFAARVGERLDACVRAGTLPNVHAVLVERRGAIAFERYFAGEDARWGAPLGHVEFGPDTLHDLRSVTKSLVGLLYGIALDEGKVPPPRAALLDHLPECADLRADPERRRLTVEHALTMRLGLEWNEDLPYTDPHNSEIAMELSPDRCRFVLERAVVEAPGTRWVYCGGATALLAHLIEAGTGMALEDYARTRLFEPLGIGDFEWVAGADGVAVAASGLRLRPRDLAWIGRLVLDGGTYRGAAIVPGDWLDASLRAHARVDDDLGYGYQWWIARKWHWAAAFGNGGQRLTVLPRADLVVVVTAGNYDADDAWRVPVEVLVEAVVPALGE